MKALKFYTFISLMAFGLLLLLCSANKSNSFEKVVGTYDAAGNIKITADTLELRSIFQNDLKSNGINTTLDKIEIRKGIVDGTAQEYFVLIANNNDSTVHIATQVFASSKSAKALVVMMKSDKNYKSTCVCNGCKTGCAPSLYKNNQHKLEWECTACQVENANDCRKTVTATP